MTSMYNPIRYNLIHSKTTRNSRFRVILLERKRVLFYINIIFHNNLSFIYFCWRFLTFELFCFKYQEVCNDTNFDSWCLIKFQCQSTLSSKAKRSSKACVIFDKNYSDFVCEYVCATTWKWHTLICKEIKLVCCLHFWYHSDI